jgi:stage III sporulation protein AH
VGEDPSKPTGGEPNSTDSYFSSVEVSRQRARDEALEVLNAVVENADASEEVKAEAMAEIQTIAKEMSQESNIESILMSKGFAQCLAVINGDSANIVVRTEGQLQSSQLAQINAVVYEQAGIEPVNITIVAKS